MHKTFKISDLSPDRLAKAVRDARQEMALPTSELAKNAGVEFSSVSRVEDEGEDPGILTAMAVAEAAKIVSFNGLAPDHETSRFVDLLFDDPCAAARFFDEVAVQYLRPSLPGEAPPGLFALYTSTRMRGRFQVVETIALSSQIQRSEAGLLTPLPRDIGNISKECLKLSRKTGIERVPKNQDQLFWNHLTSGRAVNVSARRLAQAVRAVSCLIEECQLMKSSVYEGLVCAAFANYLQIEKTYSSRCRETGIKKKIDFWNLIYDFVRMLRMIQMDELYSDRSN